MVESGCNFLHAYIYIYNCKKIWIDKDKDVENIFQNNVVFFHHEYLIYIYILHANSTCKNILLNYFIH